MKTTKIVLPIAFAAGVLIFSFSNCSKFASSSSDLSSLAQAEKDQMPSDSGLPSLIPDLTSPSNNQKISCAESNKYGWTTSSLQALTYGQNLSIYDSLIDSKNHIYLIGGATVNGKAHWVVYKSVDQGLNWSLIDDEATDYTGPVGYENTYGQHLVRGADDTKIYALGSIGDHVIIKASSDSGAHWSRIEDFQMSGSVKTYPSTLLALNSASGTTLLYAGTIVGASGNQSYVRKSTDNGANWTTTDLTAAPTDAETKVGSSSANKMVADSNGNLFVIGDLKQADGLKWRIRKSTNAGTTWSDASGSGFQRTANKNGSAYSLFLHQNNWEAISILMGGFSIDENNVSHSIIRQSTDHGATWNTVDDVIGKGVVQIFADQQGNLYASSTVLQPSSTLSSVRIRKSIDNGKTWSDFDSFLLESGKNSLAMNIMVDTQGTLLFPGISYNYSNASNTTSFIRQLKGRFPATLSGTCLYEDKALTPNSSEVTEFAPKYALWSDGAQKRRWIYLPAGTKIDSSVMDHWVFPVGTKLWKEFAIDGKKIETRLLTKVRNESGLQAWEQITYKWNPQQTEANLIFEGEADVHGTALNIPKANLCIRCHQGSSDFALGFEALQLSQASAPPEFMTLDKLKEKNLLTNPPTMPIEIPGNAVDQAAIGYLHVNCGVCHSPTGTAPNKTGTTTKIGMNLRHNYAATSVAESNAYLTLVNINGYSNATTLIKPGDPAGSRVYVRIDGKSMPPVAVEARDAVGAATLENWILSLTP
jgi:hypothetical protein